MNLFKKKENPVPAADETVILPAETPQVVPAEPAAEVPELLPEELPELETVLPTAEEAEQLAADVVAEPVPELIPEPVPEPVTELVTEPAPEPVSEPEPVEEPVTPEPWISLKERKKKYRKISRKEAKVYLAEKKLAKANGTKKEFRKKWRDRKKTWKKSLKKLDADEQEAQKAGFKAFRKRKNIVFRIILWVLVAALLVALWCFREPILARGKAAFRAWLYEDEPQTPQSVIVTVPDSESSPAASTDPIPEASPKPAKNNGVLAA